MGVKWFEWERESAILPLSFFWEGSTTIARTGFGRGWPDSFAFYRNDVILWLNRLNELRDYGQYLIDRLLKPREMAKFRKWLALGRNTLLIEFRRVSKIDLHQLSDIELLELEGRLWLALKEKLGVTGLVVEPVAIQGEVLLRKMLDGQPKAEKKLSVLATCSKHSFSARQEMELLKIAADHRINSTNVAKAFKKDKSFNDAIELHASKYHWLQNGYLRTVKLTPAHFAKELEALIKEKEPAQILDGLQTAFAAKNREKRELLKELMLDASQENLVELLDFFAWFQDYRKELTLQALHYLDELLAEICRRGGYTIEDAKYAFHSELPLLIKGKISKSVLQKRRDNCAIIMLENSAEATVLVGRKATAFKEKLLPNRGIASAIVELKGMTANPGRAKGRARVTMNAAEANAKLKQGEILVTSMTSPDFVQALKRAAAIVTNEGGITCHAAVVSREFGIPCVIGTKIATKALKDGQMVEVDASHGVVRVIEE